MGWLRRWILKPSEEAARWLWVSGRRLTVPLRAAWLIAVYWISISLVVIIFGAHQLQSELDYFPNAALTNEESTTAAPPVGDVAETADLGPQVKPIQGLGNLLSRSLDLRIIEDQLLDAQAQLAEAQRRFAEAQSKASEAIAAQTGPEARLALAISAFCQSYEKFSTLSVAKALSGKGCADFLFAKRGIATARAQALAVQSSDETGALDAAVQALREAEDAAIEAEIQIESAERLQALAKQRLDEQREATRRFEQDYQDYVATFSPADLTAAEQVNSFDGLEFLTFNAVNAAGALGLHPTVLTLILTLVMGCLGTTITVTSQFFRAPMEKSLVWYMFRPALGVVTALAVYVAFRAGQIGLSGSGTTEDLNPFVISFFAVAAGLVSEDAIKQLSRLGRGLFGGKTEASEGSLARAGLAEAMAEAGATPESLAEALGTTVATVQRWIDRAAPVPVRAQRRIADLLAKPPGELFEPLS